MEGIKKIQQLNQYELEHNVNESASWHTQYKDSSYIFIGGLSIDLKEEDILTIFSQFGVPDDIKLVQDKQSGESKGICFLSYQDKRSTILAVDNFNGIMLLERPIKVDHCHYKPFFSDDPDEMAKEDEYKQKVQRLLQASPESVVPQVSEDQAVTKNVDEKELEDPMTGLLSRKQLSKVRKPEIDFQKEHAAANIKDGGIFIFSGKRDRDKSPQRKDSVYKSSR